MLFTVIFGLVTGSIYGLTSMGLVLTYQTSGVFNLAHGAVGMAGTYLFWWLWVDHGVPLLPALALTLLIFAPLLGAALYVTIFRGVRGRSAAASLVATIVVMLVLQGLVGALFGTAPKNPLPSLFPGEGVRLTGVLLTTRQIGTGVVTALLAGLLMAHLRFTRFGLRTRAVVDNEELSKLNAEPTQRIQMANWMMGSVASVLAGILISQFIEVSTTALTLVVIQAVAAAVLGGLRSLPLTYAGGLGLGLLEKLLAQYGPNTSLFQGFRVSVSFVVLYLAVLVGALVFGAFRGEAGEAEGGYGGILGREVDRDRLLPLVVAFVGVGLYLSVASPFPRYLVMAGLAVSVALQGFVLVTGLGGQVMLAQGALVGVGGVFYGRAVSEWQWPILAAAVLAVSVSTAIGLAVALPAVRVRGVPLALLTFALGLFADNFLFKTALFGGSTGYQVARFDLFGLDLRSDYRLSIVLLVVAFATALAVRNVSVGRTGRILTAVKNAEIAAEAFGIATRRSKIVLFSLSSALAGLSGILLTVLIQSVVGSDFRISLSVTYLAVAILGGVGSAQGALFGGLLLYLAPEWIEHVGLSDYYQVVFGVGAATILIARQGGVGDIFSRALLALSGGSHRHQTGLETS